MKSEQRILYNGYIIEASGYDAMPFHVRKGKTIYFYGRSISECREMIDSGALEMCTIMCK